MITTSFPGLFRGGMRPRLALVLSKGFYTFCLRRKDLPRASDARCDHPQETEGGRGEQLKEGNPVA